MAPRLRAATAQEVDGTAKARLGDATASKLEASRPSRLVRTCDNIAGKSLLSPAKKEEDFYSTSYSSWGLLRLGVDFVPV